MWATSAAKVGFKWQVCNGKRILFWEDIWLGNCSLTILFWDLYIIINEEQCTLADAWDGSILSLLSVELLVLLCFLDGLNWLPWFRPSLFLLMMMPPFGFSILLVSTLLVLFMELLTMVVSFPFIPQLYGSYIFFPESKFFYGCFQIMSC
jgi:hypothetical protein